MLIESYVACRRFEIKSVYVRNVRTTMASSEIREAFKKFGKLRPDGVAIWTRKDIDVCYAFVEFEDISGVQNAIKEGKVFWVVGLDKSNIITTELGLIVMVSIGNFLLETVGFVCTIRVI
ncbi:RNA-binding (RRM/RBD/RNP motifs) family protein, partial [Striga asiatica]